MSRPAQDLKHHFRFLFMKLNKVILMFQFFYYSTIKKKKKRLYCFNIHLHFRTSMYAFNVCVCIFQQCTHYLLHTKFVLNAIRNVISTNDHKPLLPAEKKKIYVSEKKSVSKTEREKK